MSNESVSLHRVESLDELKEVPGGSEIVAVWDTGHESSNRMVHGYFNGVHDKGVGPGQKRDGI